MVGRRGKQLILDPTVRRLLTEGRIVMSSLAWHLECIYFIKLRALPLMVHADAPTSSCPVRPRSVPGSSWLHGDPEGPLVFKRMCRCVKVSFIRFCKPLCCVC